MYNYTSDVIINGKDTIFRLAIFNDRELITQIEGFEDYYHYRLTELMIEDLVHYLNRKNIEAEISMSERIKAKLSDYFNIMTGRHIKHT